MTASQMIAVLDFCEVDGKLAPDCRRVLREQRDALAAALGGGKAAGIAAAMKEAARVCAMWGVELWTPVAEPKCTVCGLDECECKPCCPLCDFPLECECEGGTR